MLFLLPEQKTTLGYNKPIILFYILLYYFDFQIAIVLALFCKLKAVGEKPTALKNCVLL